MTVALLIFAAAMTSDLVPTLAVNPERVCADGRSNRNLNFDIMVRNPGAKALAITEVRASSRNRAGQLIEQRLLWQRAVEILGESGTIPARGERLIFNPFTFDHPQRAAWIDYAISFDDGSTQSVKVVPSDCSTKARLQFPLKGRILVYDGYDALSHHRRDDWHLDPELKAFGVVDNVFRYALDFIPVDPAGSLARGDGRSLGDFYGWNAPVYAPGNGKVIASRGSIPDNPLGGEDFPRAAITEDQMNPSGNYILIEHGPGEVSVLTHLKAGSVTVKPGDQVASGQLVARIGNSGATPIPHLHYELRTGFGIRGTRTMPPYFQGVSAIGAAPAPGPFAPNTGDIIISR